MKWAYGVTTVPARFKDLLPLTLRSLDKAGFPSPRLFIDGVTPDNIPSELKKYEITSHYPNLRTFGNWTLALWELYVRDPHADRYALFQDDLITYPNLREYLDKCEMPATGYWNLYLWPENEARSKGHCGWYLSNQRGLGAVGLVFSNEGVRVLLRQQHMVDRPLDDNRGHKAIDGGIVDSMKKVGWKEWVHNPSLLQHTGIKSSMGNGKQALASSFKGENFDAMSLISSATTTEQITVTPAREPSKVESIGLVGYNTSSGLGELNRQISTYCGINSWLIQPHKEIASLSTPTIDGVTCTICPKGASPIVMKFVKSMDVLLFCETPYYMELVDYARINNKRTVCVPMMEWMPAGAKGWPKDVSLFICPTKHCYEQFSHVVPCVYFPWPVDTERFKFQQRTTCNKFLFVAGHGGFGGRKGIDVVREAKKMWPEMPLVVRSQRKIDWGDGITVETLPPTGSNADLYRDGDVLIAPHSVDGLGLEPMEAMACGMPVITTDGKPWNEIPSIGKIMCRIEPRKVARPVDWHIPKPGMLIKICQNLLGKNIERQSLEAREWAEERSWTKQVDKFIELVKHGKPERP